jgi:hypothetical protein
MWIFAETVYVVSLLTSLACMALLVRGYCRSRRLLLLCGALCFVFLSLNNLLLFVDVVMLPNTDLRLYRSIVALAGVAVMLYGFIWEPE